MAEFSQFFSLGGLGGFLTGTTFFIVFYGMMIGIFIFAGIIIKKRIGFDYLANIHRKQANGILYLRDFISIKSHKNDRTKKFWELYIARKKIPLLPNHYIAQTKQSIIYFRKKGAINLYEDEEGNFYPMMLSEHRINEEGNREPIIYPEPRDWKEAFAQDVVYRSQKLTPAKWYQNTAALAITAIAIVGIVIVIMIKVGGPMIG